MKKRYASPRTHEVYASAQKALMALNKLSLRQKHLLDCDLGGLVPMTDDEMVRMRERVAQIRGITLPPRRRPKRRRK